MIRFTSPTQRAKCDQREKCGKIHHNWRWSDLPLLPKEQSVTKERSVVKSITTGGDQIYLSYPKCNQREKCGKIYHSRRWSDLLLLPKEQSVTKERSVVKSITAWGIQIYLSYPKCNQREKCGKIYHNWRWSDLPLLPKEQSVTKERSVVKSITTGGDQIYLSYPKCNQREKCGKIYHSRRWSDLPLLPKEQSVTKERSVVKSITAWGIQIYLSYPKSKVWPKREVW